ncbi:MULTISPECIES: hypothetical protein [unclassified Halorhabdus]|uniref:hypothetical protein n=1 Tax=unclassified Halorhabdus TaxID=2621901 RepID=UPI0023DCD7E2|nr:MULTISPECIES: hypothetical protein [unclassified Halorhabdus]WEL17845.1 hypothetical protein SVXHr_1678 [Halorhabdus sp. SVX81]WEL21721.1 hypothetical protein HBNXHr_1660 [Halorhabdus sp. BNX81]
MRRRELLAVAGTIGCAGCADLSSIDESTTASSFPPATAVWHVVPPYPFRFDGEVTVSDGTIKGWVLDDTISKRVSVTGEVIDGGPVSVYFSEYRIEQPEIPESPIEEFTDVSTIETAVEFPDGGGSFFFAADTVTTIDLEIEIETV